MKTARNAFIFLVLSINSFFLIAEPLTILSEPYYRDPLSSEAPKKFKDMIQIGTDENGLINSIDKTTIQFYEQKVTIEFSNSKNKIFATIHDNYNKDIIIEVNIESNSINYSIQFGNGNKREGTLNVIDMNQKSIQDENYYFLVEGSSFEILQKIKDGFEKTKYNNKVSEYYYKDFLNGKNTYKYRGVNLVVDEDWFGEDWSTVFPSTSISDLNIHNDDLLINIANYIVLDCFSSRLSFLLGPVLFCKDL
jgi:hypothetical protein